MHWVRSECGCKLNTSTHVSVRVWFASTCLIRGRSRESEANANGQQFFGTGTGESADGISPSANSDQIDVHASWTK